MMNLEPLRRSVEQLNPDDLGAFRAWFTKYDMERDVGAGRDVPKDFGIFRELVNAHVLATLTVYGFAHHESRFLDPGMWVNIRNGALEIAVYFEYGSGISLKILRLEAGTAAYTGENLYIADLLWVRAPHRIPQTHSREFHAQVLAAELKEQVSLLRRYAHDVLRGDVAIYTILRPVLEQRRTWFELDVEKPL